MGYSAILSAEVDVDSPGKAELFQKVKDNFDYLYSMMGGTVELPNGSFEIDTDADGTPDNWTLNLYVGGSAAYDTSTPAHGAKAYKFTRAAGAGNGGGDLESGYMECSEIGIHLTGFDIKNSAIGLRNIVRIRYFYADKTHIAGSDEDIYDSESSPTSWTRYHLAMTVPSGARYYKIKLIGGDTAPSADVAGDTYFDDVAISNKVVNQAMLKTTVGQVGGAAGHYTRPGGDYAFMPTFQSDLFPNDLTAQLLYNKSHLGTGGWYSLIYLSAKLYAQCRYVTSSGTEYWVFVLYDKLEHKILAAYAAPDHPCYGNGGDENAVPHPFPDYYSQELSDNLEIVLLDMVTINELRRRADAEKRIIPMLLAEYDVDLSCELDFIPRDIDGHRMLMHKHPSYKVRRLIKKEV